MNDYIEIPGLTYVTLTSFGSSLTVEFGSDLIVNLPDEIMCAILEYPAVAKDILNSLSVKSLTNMGFAESDRLCLNIYQGKIPNMEIELFSYAYPNKDTFFKSGITNKNDKDLLGTFKFSDSMLLNCDPLDIKLNHYLAEDVINLLLFDNETFNYKKFFLDKFEKEVQT